jgi:diguanylate cyclase (GGDEF)-like protein
VLAFDLDELKTINDSYGHGCGDRALQEVGKTVAGSLRPTDIVGRWGGDELLAILRNVNHEILTSLAKRCVLMAARISLPTRMAKQSLSISLGATLAYQGETAEELIHRADRMSGRDCATTG